MPDPLESIEHEIDEINRDIRKRHESNQKKFNALDSKVGQLNTSVKWIVALILANGGLNVAHFFLGTK